MEINDPSPKHHDVNSSGGVEVWLHALTSALDDGTCSATSSGRLILGVRVLDNHWIRAWVEPSESPNVGTGEDKNPCLYQESNSGGISHHTDHSS
jgi:hypothetical protein